MGAVASSNVPSPGDGPSPLGQLELAAARNGVAPLFLSATPLGP